MTVEIGRRAFLSSAVGGGWLGVSSRSWLGLSPKPVSIAEPDLDIREPGALRTIDGRIVVGGWTRRGVVLEVFDDAGRPVWERGYRTDDPEDVEDIVGTGWGEIVVCTENGGLGGFSEDGDLLFSHRVPNPGEDVFWTYDRVATAGGSIYLLGTAERSGRDQDGRAVLLSKVSARGKTNWQRRLPVTAVGQGEGLAIVHFDAADGRLRLLLNERAPESGLTRLELGQDGSVIERSTLGSGADGAGVPAMPDPLRAGPDGYVGVAGTDRGMLVHLDEELRLAGEPTGAPFGMWDAAALADGSHLVATGGDIARGAEHEVVLARLDRSGSVVWRRRLDAPSGTIEVEAVGDSLVSVSGGDLPHLNVMEEQDGSTVTPLLGVTGAAAGLTLGGALLGGVDDG